MSEVLAPVTTVGSAVLPPILELRELRAAYGAIEVLHGIDMVVPAGGIFAVLGPNGAGKSTMLRVIAGLHPATAGVVVLGGRAVNRARPDELARRGIERLADVVGLAHEPRTSPGRWVSGNVR